MRDFWNVPCFNELLAVTQRYVGMAVDGEMPTMDALKELAEEKERILKENGLLRGPFRADRGRAGGSWLAPPRARARIA